MIGGIISPPPPRRDRHPITEYCKAHQITLNQFAFLANIGVLAISNKIKWDCTEPRDRRGRAPTNRTENSSATVLSIKKPHEILNQKGYIERVSLSFSGYPPNTDISDILKKLIKRGGPVTLEDIRNEFYTQRQ